MILRSQPHGFPVDGKSDGQNPYSGSKPVKTVLGWILLCILLPLMLNPQKELPRVERARKKNDLRLSQLFRNRNLPYPPPRVFLRALKKEQELELWVWSEHSTYTLLKSYPFCSSSGVLGPKRRQGDLQIPEGFYYIDRFNPWSQFYLSLGINYPNQSDRIRGSQQDPGGDIFIHGSCVTIGCIPLTDEKIMELYWICHQARKNGQRRIPVHIFPARLDDSNFDTLTQIPHRQEFWKRYKSLIGNNHPHTPDQLIGFWKNLKGIYDHFENTLKLPRIRIDSKGKYHIRE